MHVNAPKLSNWRPRMLGERMTNPSGLILTAVNGNYGWAIRATPPHSDTIIGHVEKPIAIILAPLMSANRVFVMAHFDWPTFQLGQWRMEIDVYCAEDCIHLFQR